MSHHLAHAEISMAALKAGKHVYSEKPLSTTVAEGRQILQLANQRGRQVGCAPDTFLGSAIQAGQQLLDEGQIGQAFGASIAFMSHGMESWHPNPAFFYQPGGGPMYDMGVYFLTALVSLLGPVKQVSGAGLTAFPTRTIAVGPHAGQDIPVNTLTHLTGSLQLASGALVDTRFSFDVWRAETRLDIYGTRGTLFLNNPNNFGPKPDQKGSVRPLQLRIGPESTIVDVPVRNEEGANRRGLGLSDLVQAIREGRGPRASGELALHVLEIMESVLRSAELQGQPIPITTTCARPKPLATPALT